MSWRQIRDNKAKIDRAGKTIRGGTTEFAGVLNFDNISAQLLLTEDNGVLHVRLVDEDTMQVIYVEQGDHEATLFRTVIKRHRDD